MQRTKYTPEQKAEALQLLAEVGKAEASRRSGIPAGTIASWGSRVGVQAPPAEATMVATASRLATVAERKSQLASDLLDDAQKLRAQLFTPCVERKAMTISGGMHNDGRIEIADIDKDQPAFAEQRQIMTSIAIAVDKIQILTGEATQRIETLGDSSPRLDPLQVADELERRRQAKGAA